MSEATLTHCSFCGKHKDNVARLIVGHDVAICNECVDLCQTLLNDKKIKSKNAEINKLFSERFKTKRFK